MKEIKFYKYHGTGNDFLLIDDRKCEFSESNERLITTLCQRRFGIGADGLILLRGQEEADFKMIYFNADGKVGSMCGNGGRCAVQFARDLGIDKTHFHFEAVDGMHEAYFKNGMVSLKMMNVQEVNRMKDHYVLNTGSPHYIIFQESIDDINLMHEARKIRYSEKYSEQGININYVERIEEQFFKIRTYERGVEGETFSCGTGVVAAAIATFLQRKSNGNANFRVQTKGGELTIKFSGHKDSFVDIWLTGPAKFVYNGIYNIRE